MQTARITLYPWDRLDRVPRELARSGPRIRRSLAEFVDVDVFGRALGELCASRVTLVVRRVLGIIAPPDPARSVFFETADGAVGLAVEAEAALVATAVGRLLDRAVVVSEPFAPLAPPLRGAFSALLVEGARRSGASRELRTRAEPLEVIHGVCVEATVLLDEAPYGVRLFAAERPRPTVESASPGLAALGDLPVAVPFVVATSAGAFQEVSALAPGDVWLPGTGWFGNARGGDESSFAALFDGAVLAPPDADWGIGVARSDAGQIVLRGNVVGLPLDVAHDASLDRTTGKAMNESDRTLEALVLDAPVVVRVEVGAVTLSAKKWAELRPGDVLETGVPLSAPVVLRVAGREVARGELVSVDGELGVRISKIVPASDE